MTIYLNIKSEQLLDGKTAIAQTSLPLPFTGTFKSLVIHSLSVT